MKILGVILLAVACIAFAGCTSTTDSVSSDTSAVVSDSDPVLDLTSEGENLSNEIVAWSTDGQGNPVGACSEIDSIGGKVDRLGEIVSELEGMGASGVAPLRGAYNRISTGYLGIRTICTSMGY